MKRRSFGFVAGPSRPRAAAPDPHTSEGLLEISKRDGHVAAATAAAEKTIATGKKSEVRFGQANGETFAVLAKDEPKDPRTLNQQLADDWIKQSGMHSPMPKRLR